MEKIGESDEKLYTTQRILALYCPQYIFRSLKIEKTS